MNWNLEGQRVKGMYINEFPVEGIVKFSRVKYGGSVTHVVILDETIEVYGTIHDIVLLEDKQILDVLFIKEVA